MAIIGSIIKKGITITNTIKKVRSSKPEKWQRSTLLKLLKKAKNTDFGQMYKFEKILTQNGFNKQNEMYDLFKSLVPIHDYNKMYEEWWSTVRKGKKNVTWPGEVKYFALSSGTSDATSKVIPVTKAMIKAIHKASISQVLALGHFKDIPNVAFQKDYLMLGGSTSLTNVDNHFEGDLSGITVGKIPFWFERFYKPGKEIGKKRNWEKKLNSITVKAAEWDVSIVAGVPAWIQILFERIIEHYKVKDIHEIWPNLVAYGWGGVAIEPYKEGFSKLLNPDKPFYFLETYLASEGFIAYQAKPDGHLQMILNNGIFYEFIPFTEKNFDEDGELKLNPQTIMISDVKELVEYALLLTTCAGAWRYLIGDTIKFVDKKNAEIVITGRTKQFLSLCGEHLSIDNMNKAIFEVSEEKDLNIKEFTVIGCKHNSLFAHHWYIGCDQKVDELEIAKRLDHHLCRLNDDYAVERQHALENIIVHILPPTIFLDWLTKKGKLGGQNKFPRVLKGQLAEQWKTFVQHK